MIDEGRLRKVSVWWSGVGGERQGMDVPRFDCEGMHARLGVGVRQIREAASLLQKSARCPDLSRRPALTRLPFLLLLLRILEQGSGFDLRCGLNPLLVPLLLCCRWPLL